MHPRWRFDLQLEQIFSIRQGREIIYLQKTEYNDGEYSKDNKVTKIHIFFSFLIKDKKSSLINVGMTEVAVAIF